MTVPETEKHRPEEINKAINEGGMMDCRACVSCRGQDGQGSAGSGKLCALQVVVQSPAGVEGEVGCGWKIRGRADISQSVNQSISQQTDCQFAE